MPLNGFAVEAGAQAAVRRARALRHELRRGVHGLTVVSVTACSLGVFGSCMAIACSFTGVFGYIPFTTWLSYLAGDLSRSLLPCIVGLGSAVVAFLIRDWIVGRSHRLEHETHLACYEVVYALRRLPTQPCLLTDSPLKPPL